MSWLHCTLTLLRPCSKVTPSPGDQRLTMEQGILMHSLGSQEGVYTITLAPDVFVLLDIPASLARN